AIFDKRRKVRTIKNPLPMILLFSLPTPAQTALDRIRVDDLKAHMFFLAAGEMGGRGAGSLENQIAANYIAAHFMRLGLKPVGDRGTYFQSFNLVKAWPDWEGMTLKSKIHDVEKTYQLGQDFDYPIQCNNPADLVAPLAFLGYGISAPE